MSSPTAEEVEAGRLAAYDAIRCFPLRDWDRDDVAQAALMGALLRYDETRGMAWSSFVYMEAVSLASKSLRGDRRRDALAHEASRRLATNPEPRLAADEPGLRDLVAHVNELLDILPIQDAHLLRQRHVAGMKPREIAARSGCTPQIASYRLKRATARFRRLFESQERDLATSTVRPGPTPETYGAFQSGAGPRRIVEDRPVAPRGVTPSYEEEFTAKFADVPQEVPEAHQDASTAEVAPEATPTPGDAPAAAQDVLEGHTPPPAQDGVEIPSAGPQPPAVEPDQADTAGQAEDGEAQPEPADAPVDGEKVAKRKKGGRS